MDSISANEFHVSRCIRYHTKRQAYYDLMAKTFGWISLVTSTAAFTALIGKAGEHSELAMCLAFIVAAIQSADLFIKPSEMARHHSEMRARYVILGTELVGAQDTKEQRTRFLRLRWEIQKDEKPPILVLNDVCHNEEYVARGGDEASEHYAKIGRLHKLCANLGNFGYTPKPTPKPTAKPDRETFPSS